jgi:hypothetical protein
MIFAQSNINDPNVLISWELLVGGKVVFRDENETAKWLAINGDQLGGYHFDSGYLFGPMGSYGTIIKREWLDSKPFDFTNGKQWGIDGLSIRKNLTFLGVDRKGLIDTFCLLPWRVATGRTKSDSFCFVILDPWQNKAVFVPLRPGQNLPPDGVSTGLPRSLAPDGSIYFFDVDLPDKQFVLSRVVNTWWDELGLTHTLSATVNDNRVRIRDKPGTQGQILDYLYENEVARITDQTPQPDEVSGVKAPWYKISMPDGRQGWVFGQFLNLEIP